MSRKSSTAFVNLSDLVRTLPATAKVRVGKEWARAQEAANGIVIPLESDSDETPATPAAKATDAKATATVA